MHYDITLTGPPSSADAARDGLVAAGFDVRSNGRDHDEVALTVRGEDRTRRMPQ